MKYNKEWKRSMSEYAIPSIYVIPYDKWKKWIKHPTFSFLWNWKRNLYLQCDKIDEALFGTPRVPLCTNPNDNITLQGEDMVRACAMNRTTLYKTCKKIDKKLLHTSEAKHWFKMLVESKRYQFLGCPELLRVKFSVYAYECPVCFEDLCDINVYMNPCEHMVCKPCAKKIKTLCPLCRSRWDYRFGHA